MAGDIRQWLRGLGLDEFADAFERNRIELSHLPQLTDDDLRELGVAAMGDRKTLMRAIAALVEASKSDDSNAPTDVPPTETRHISGERRQLTVFFCDLVESTALSQRLDPEDLTQVMRHYQDAVAGAVARYGGHVAKFLGDGVLAYFGWPHAYEDQAERAIRSGLDAINAVGRRTIAGGEALHSRVSIATGQVVVGDLVGDSATDIEAVVGETPNLAARLQGAAKPDQVVIEGTTRRLVGQSFELVELGALNLRGFSAAVPAWRVVGEGVSESRFEAAHTDALPAFVGREHELGLLTERWELAKGGEGQIVLVSGEAGIGKSRLVRALRDVISREDHFRLRYQCSPHHVNSAFYPIIQRLERTAGFSSEDSAQRKLNKLETLLKMSEGEIDEAVPLFAGLLAVPLDARYQEPELTPQQRRDRTINTMIRQVIALSRQRPVLFILEDAHWIDPTTEALLGETMVRIGDAPVLMVITHRPEYASPWNGHPHLTSIALNRLGRDQVTEIVNAVGGRDLSAAIIDRIIARADGVPLYVEELTKSVLEASGQEASPTASNEIPMSLQSSLIARLDHLGEAKEVAQIGAVIGRSFSYALIKAASSLPDAALNAALDRILGSELAFRQGTPPEATYTFKHALVQDTAYNTLLRGRRAELHGQIARALTTHFADMAETRPELFAFHYTEAGLARDAVPYWQRAGRRAAERSAVPEAIAHLSKGLDLLDELSESPERDEMELSLKVWLGPALISAKGFASDDAQKTLARARELCIAKGDNENLFPVLFGLWIGNNSRGAVSMAKGIADDLMRSTEGVKDSGQRLQAHHCYWTSEFFSGNPSSCYHHTGLGEQIYDIDTHRMHKFLYGAHDPGVCAAMFRCMSGWLLGRSDRSVQHANDAIALGEELGHARSLAMALYHAAAIHYFRGEAEVAAERAERAIAICIEHNMQVSGTLILRDRARVELGDRKEAVASLAKTIDQLRSGGDIVSWPWFLAIQAETDAELGLARPGIQKIDEALAYAERTGERWVDGDLHRIKGDLLLAESARNADRAAAEFGAAISIARAQSAKAIELRAATRLARLQAENGRNSEAYDLLLPIYTGFSEGLSTRDLKEAQTLVAQLS